MPVETETDVSQMKRVQDEEGNRAAPATERAARGNFANGNSAVATVSADYPVVFDPADTTIYELLVFASGADVSVEIETVGGDVFTIPLDGGTAVLDTFEIARAEFLDPGSDQRTVVAWSGE